MDWRLGGLTSGLILVVLAVGIVAGGDGPEETDTVAPSEHPGTAPVLAFESFEAGLGEAWQTDPGLEVDERDRWRGQQALHIEATSGEERLEATFSPQEADAASTFSAFVAAESTADGEGMHALELRTDAGETVTALRLTPEGALEVLDDGAWQATHAHVDPGAWVKLSVRSIEDRLGVFLDDKPVTAVTPGAEDPVGDLVFAIPDGSGGRLSVDDVALSEGRLGGGSFLDTQLDSVLGRQPGSWELCWPREDPLGTNAIHVTPDGDPCPEAQVNLSGHVSPYRFSIDVSEFGDDVGESCLEQGTMVRLATRAGDAIVELACTEAGLAVTDGSDRTLVAATTAREAYTRFTFEIGTHSYEAWADGDRLGSFALGSTEPASAVTVGGGGADVWLGSIRIEDLESHIAVHPGDGELDEWTYREEPLGGSIAETDERYRGEAAVRIHAPPGLGATEMSRSLEIPEDASFRAEVQAFVPAGAPQGPVFDGFRLPMLVSDRGEEAGFELRRDDDSVRGIELRTRTDAGAVRDSETRLAPGWHTFAVEVDRSPGSVHVALLVDGSEIMEGGSDAPTFQRVRIGDPGPSSLLAASSPGTGAGEAIVDGVRVVEVADRPHVRVEEPEDGDTVEHGTVEVRGTYRVPDVGVPAEHLYVFAHDEGHYPIKQTSWTFAWDTSRIETDESYVRASVSTPAKVGHDTVRVAVAG